MSDNFDEGFCLALTLPSTHGTSEIDGFFQTYDFRCDETLEYIFDDLNRELSGLIVTRAFDFDRETGIAVILSDEIAIVIDVYCTKEVQVFHTKHGIISHIDKMMRLRGAGHAIRDKPVRYYLSELPVGGRFSPLCSLSILIQSDLYS